MSSANAQKRWSPARRVSPGTWELAKLDGSVSVRVLLSPADESLVDGVVWRLSAYGYAERDAWVDGKAVRLYLHRLVAGAQAGQDVDHVNRDRLDNRRQNLRVCSRAENRQNTRSLGGSSRFRGVYWNPRRRKWIASYGRAPHRLFHQAFDDEVQAALAIWRWRVENLPMCAQEARPV